MYRSFYNLHSKPFQISSDPAFMWFGEKHREAFATLKYGILDNKGFLLLTGDVGTGKTSLINALLQQLEEDIICTSVPDPSLDKLDFFNYISASFGMNREFQTKGSFLAHFRQFLLQAYDNGKKVLLIIDEAQLLTQEMLEEIRLLSNIEKADAKLINIFFIGQNEFNQILNQPQNRAVRQRLTLNYNLDPLTPEETENYIQHRLKIAGSDKMLFDPSAVQEIFLYSGGFPRRINILCDHCLLSGYVNEQETITGRIVQECAKELKIPAHAKIRDVDGYEDPAQIIPEPEKSTPQPSRQPSAAGPQLPAPVQAPPPQNQANKGSAVTGWAIGVFAFCLFAWVFLLPADLKDSILTAFQDRISENPVIEKPILKKTGQDPANQGLIKSETIKTEESQIELPQPNQIPVENNFSSDEKTQPANPLPPDESTPKLDPQPMEDQNLARKPLLDEPRIEDFIKTPSAAAKEETNLRTPDQKKPVSEDEMEKSSARLPTEKIIVRFRYNTNEFTDKGLENLEQFARVLSQHPEAMISIIGHTDSEGYTVYNKRLSEFRANIVKSYLLGKGIGSHQMQTSGLGGSQPIESNNTTWGKQMNRRVEIEVIKK